MAIFSNRATLTYNGTTTDSNIAYGELLETLTVEKSAVEASYGPGGQVTYVVTLRNTGATPLTGLTLSDNLGATTFGTQTVYPLRYDGTPARLYVNGAQQADPTVTAGPPMTVTGINIPAGGDAVLVYRTQATGFADPGAGGTIVNTVTLSGAGLTAPVTADNTLAANTAPALTISKSISPAQVTDNDRVTYTFLIQNTGATEVTVTDNAVITDTFDPILTALAVTYNGAAWVPGTQYTYNEATGLFTTTAGQITVPAATYTQDPVTGEYTLTPGTVTLSVTGTI